MTNSLQQSQQRNLMTAYTSAVQRDQSFSDDDLKVDVSERIQFKWKDYDRATVAQIKAASKLACDDIFGELLDTIDRFYASFRQPRLNAAGVTLIDERNRIVWETDEHGRFVDNFENLTGQDVEEAILQLQRDKIAAAQQVNDLFLEALFAKHVYDDFFHERYEALLDGTIADRNARATRDTKQEKYQAFFRFYLYQQADVLFKEIENLTRILERVRQWRVSDAYQERRDGRQL